MLNAALLKQALQGPGRLVVSGVPGGLEALVLADAARMGEWFEPERA